MVQYKLSLLSLMLIGAVACRANEGLVGIDNPDTYSPDSGASNGGPAIVSFTASPAGIVTGQGSTLSWTVSGATSLSLDQGIGSVFGQTSQAVVPTHSTTYTLTLNGSVSAQASVTVAEHANFVPTGRMTVQRANHTATLLPNGKVLIAGGWTVPWNGTSPHRTAELYDPNTGIFTATGSMVAARGRHTATLLPKGKVLIAGGFSCDPDAYEGYGPLANAELYDPNTGLFTATGSMSVPRVGHTATLLGNGEVLFAGRELDDAPIGRHPCAELYDPVTGTFVLTGKMVATRTMAAASLLANGKVLIAGGLVEQVPDMMYGVPNREPDGSAEIYDPSTEAFTATGSMGVFGFLQSATRLLDGNVLIAGGRTFRGDGSGDVGDPGANALYDPSANVFAASACDLTTNRIGHTATLLPGGLVLIVGGEGSGGGTYGRLSAGAELYDSTTQTFAATTDLVAPRLHHTATLLPNGTVLIAGGGLSDTAELYVE